jgi:predicted O-methyltransferase YrrM
MEPLRSEVQLFLEKIPVDTGGGCSVFKAQTLAMLIAQYDLKTTLDIGVYRGRSLFPQALAHRAVTGGVVYGVDPWDMQAAQQAEVPAELREHVDKWARHTDLQQIYESVVELRKNENLQQHCELVRETSSAAIGRFVSDHTFFDLVHIDGNHDRERVASDINLYLPRLRPRGFLVLDDISWASIRPLYDEMRRRLHHVYELVDKTNDFAVFMNAPSWLWAQERRARLLAADVLQKAERLRTRFL